MTDAPESEPSEPPSERRLSYKFQRLREQIRAAIEAGDLAGKLPGERSLARQFNVNAKTLSKALTDLAADGVLERNIGLGTFVRGAGEAPGPDKLLLLSEMPAAADGMGPQSPLAEGMRSLGLDVDARRSAADLPPSALAPYDTVLVGPQVAEEVVRDLIVRGKTVITLDRLSAPLATHAVLAHPEQTAFAAARRLADLGHRRLMLAGDDDGSILTALTAALPHLQWTRVGTTEEGQAAYASGVTAALCAGPAAGRRVMDDCQAAGVPVPERMSVAAFGRLQGAAPCDGQYVTDAQIARTVADALSAGLPHKPVALWLTGEAVNAGTTAAAQAIAGQ